MNFLGSMSGINLPGMSPFGGRENKSFLEEGITGAWSPAPGFQPFNPNNPTSLFNPGGTTGATTGGIFGNGANTFGDGVKNAFSTFYNDMFQFEEDLDDAESKLDEWEEGWGVDPDEGLDKQSSPVFKDHGVEAENRLTRIYKTRDNLRKMRTRFAGVEITTDRPVRHGTTSRGGIRVDTGKTSRRMNGIQINIDANSIQRDRGQQSDSERFPGGRVQELHDDLASSTETLADLNRQIDDLNRRLPPPDKRITAGGESSDKPAGPGDSSSDSDRDLKGLSGLRQMVLEVRRMNQAQAQRKQVNFANPPEEWVNFGERRYWGHFERDGESTNVLIEWKGINAANPPPPHTTFTFKNMVRVKIESLTSLLKIPENVRPPGLRMLNCLGVFRRTKEDDVWYGLVFEVPSRKHQSLLEVLKKDAGYVKQSSLMILAKQLAKAILYLHLARWLHKGLRSQNIMLFPKVDGTFDFSEPYLIGYEYTRPAGKIAQTELVEDDFSNKLYRHPRMQGLPQELTSSPATSLREESPKPSRGDGGSSGSNDSPPIGGPSKRDSWSVPAPLMVRRDRSSSNPNAPPILVRDSSVPRVNNHRPGESSLDRPELHRRDSDREKSPFQSFHDIYALGIILLEIGLREPIKSVYDRAFRDPIYGKHFAEKFRQWILANEVPRLGIMVGDKYQEVVAICLDDTLEGMSDQELQKEFYSKVVRVLANITAHL